MEALRAYAASESEALREQALGLGREALERGYSILDLVALHAEVWEELAPGPAQGRAAGFLAEALAPYEMRLRGAQEANERLRSANDELERRVEERTRGLREKESLLHQAQKMEAMGRLAGGIAHDFNNLLTVVSGCIDTVLDGAGGGEASQDDLRMARRAADQAASLTRQLLAFSRRQPDAPRLLPLNEELEGTLSMLKRLIGARISLEVLPADPPCSAWMDPDQFSQLLMNLVLNARDALPEGGRILVSLNGVELSAGHLQAWPKARPGRFAVLSVSDNGAGMDAAVLAHIFEPFFSTKEPGKGTGLGLATVYGIVERAGGMITVHSEPSKGSAFKAYLPMDGAQPAGALSGVGNGERGRP
jgi:signal transduction histidine kinase